MTGRTGTAGRVLRRPGASAAAAFLAVLLLVALAAPFIASGTRASAPVPYDPDRVDLASRFLAPSGTHLFGTDELGRDVLARLIHGSRVSLAVGFTAAFLSLTVGALLGGIAGYLGGTADWVISRLIELALCFPFLFLALGVAALFEPSAGAVIVSLALVTWTSEAKLVRGEVLRLRESEFARAAEAIGARPMRIVIRHLLPNAIPPAIVSATFGVAVAITAESALSFLGLGVQPPAASWGSILASADQYIRSAWWLAVFPGLAIFLTVAACNALGESVRQSLDPGSRRPEP